MVMPPVIQYEREFLKQSAGEIEGGSCPALTKLSQDYKLTRDKIREVKRSFP